MIVGIIDLGSNSVRMTIADVESGKNLYNGKKTIKLSQGMNEDMMLKPDAVKRCVMTFFELKLIMEKYGVEKVCAVATAAVRKAKNREEFLSLIKRETDIEIRVLSGEEEAQLDFLGVLGATKINDAVILDTGGGSTEFIGVKDGKVIGAESVQLGSRSIKELFFKDGETESGIEKAKEEVKRFTDNIKWLEDIKGVPVIGIGGSNRTVARISMGAEGADMPIDEYKMTADKVFEIIEKIRITEPEKRNEIKGITPDRTDIIYGGVLPLEYLLKKLGSEKFVVTDAGLRDGILKQIKEENF
ncbi:MAG: Ppx/GppA family phosphatase [Ruminococcaceae bacterium]|nr:Ppx/GppA family phosphatase [Oscillospiraceae bacterium]